ncbi:hypothetical protein [Thalassorhabdomicrobium marinisediminis]|uniref:hypothetical protein n=1 Tax=Thalassorhabdomicrobium marinisediminis TaxID=2170577 RepID=UPI0024907433|nr:hypothetical protein [Thalassorhabdomicrobium marinisediminis]
MTATAVETSASPTARMVWLPFIAFILASFVAVVPILSHSYLPLVDLPNHIARHHIAANGHGALAQYYSSVSTLTPNSAVDLLWAVWGFSGDPVEFSKYVMVFYAISFIGSTMFLARVIHGHWTLWSAAVSLLVYNGTFFWGFQNFVVSVPFCSLFLGFWLLSERKHLALRLAIFFPLASILYLMHLFVFASFAVAVFGREVQVQLSQKGHFRHRLGRLAVLMLPFVVPGVWLIYDMSAAAPSPAGSHTEYGSFQDRIAGIFSPFISMNASSIPQIQILGFVSGIFVILSALTLFLKKGPRLVVSNSMAGPLISLSVAALLAPIWLSGVAFVHFRVPLILFAVFFAATQWRDLKRETAICLAIFVISVVGIRGFYMQKFVSEFDSDIHDLLKATQALPEGARVLPVRSPGMERDRRLWHAQAYIVTKRDAFVPTLFLGTHSLQLHDKWSEYAHAALFGIDVRRILDQNTYAVSPDLKFIEEWERKYNYVLLLDHDTVDLHTDSRFSIEERVGRFTLYKIEHEI